MTDDFDNLFDVVLELRGGFPEKCDWCGHAFEEGDACHPEEAGEWICDECMKNDPFYNSAG